MPRPQRPRSGFYQPISWRMRVQNSVEFLGQALHSLALSLISLPYAGMKLPEVYGIVEEESGVLGALTQWCLLPWWSSRWDGRQMQMTLPARYGSIRR